MPQHSRHKYWLTAKICKKVKYSLTGLMQLALATKLMASGLQKLRRSGLSGGLGLLRLVAEY